MSTPIETNTEELQEVLQQVYNLPNRGGGSITPDLVIKFDDTATGEMDSANQFIYDQSAVVKVLNKLRAGEIVNCVLCARYQFGSGAHCFSTISMKQAYVYDDSDQIGIWFEYNDVYDGIAMSLIYLVFTVNDDQTVTLAGNRRLGYALVSTGLEGFGWQ